MSGAKIPPVPVVFDRRLYAIRRARAARLAGDDFLVRETAEAISERLSGLDRRFRLALDLGMRKTSHSILEPHADTWLSAGATAGIEGISSVADEEALPFGSACFDLVASVLSLHAVNDLPGSLVQIRRALAPGGLFIAALFGGSTLCELRRAFAAGEGEISGGASPRVAPFADVRDMGSLLQRAGFAMPVADVERSTVCYRAFATLARDLRALGETNALAGRSRRPLSRAVLAGALAHYAACEADKEGRLIATFDIVYLTGWASRAGA